jgi:hypothetical protein
MRARAVCLAILCAVLVGCDAAAPPSASPAAASSTPAIALASPSPTAPAVATPKPTPRPTPKPTPLPVPPHPTGVNIYRETVRECGIDTGRCFDNGYSYTATWHAPRMEGVEIRFFGVTTCFRKDATGTIDGYCLRKHTAVPSSVRVLLAKASASKGTVTWRMYLGRGQAETGDGVTIYSIVDAAYYPNGRRSIFHIADPGYDCWVECR